MWCVSVDRSRRGSRWVSAVGLGIVRRGTSSLSLTYPILLWTGSQENRCIWVDAAQFPWGWGTTVCCPPRMLLLRKRETDAREQERNKRKIHTRRFLGAGCSHNFFLLFCLPNKNKSDPIGTHKKGHDVRKIRLWIHHRGELKLSQVNGEQSPFESSSLVFSVLKLHSV